MATSRRNPVRIYMELYSVNDVVYLNDLWMDEEGDISIVEYIDCQEDDGAASIKIRVLVGSTRGETFFEDESNFAGTPEIDRETTPFFTRLVFRPLTGYRDDAVIEHIAREQNGIEL